MIQSKTTVYPNISLPFKSSTLPEAGPIWPDSIGLLKTDCKSGTEHNLHFQFYLYAIYADILNPISL